jgi:hypothetical protein
MKAARRVLLTLLNTPIAFSICVSVGVSLSLTVMSSVGYLPYSDRPGPGWFGPLHWPSVQELGVYFGFAPLFAYTCLFYGIGLFLIALALRFAHLPKWLWRVVGAALSALFALLAISGAGWMIAISSAGVYSGFIFGLLYGAFVFPLSASPSGAQRPMWIRFTVPAIVGVAVLGYFLSPLIPRTPPAPVDVSLIRLTPGSTVYAPKDDRQFTAAVPKILNELQLSGEVHGGVQTMEGNTGTTDGIEAQLIAMQPITRSYKLDLPKHGAVVYVLQRDEWTAHPAIKEKDKRQVIIQPGTDSKFDGGALKISSSTFDPAKFTWYPTIPR